MQWLDKIILNKKLELEQEDFWLKDFEVKNLEIKNLEVKKIKNNKNFLDIFLNQKFAVIGELKSKSPSEGFICPALNFDPVKIALGYEQAGISAISVLTDFKFFNGSYEILKQVAEAVSVPVLCKEFILDPKQIYKAKFCGADACLLIVRILSQEKLMELIGLCESLNMTALVEVFSEQECEMAIHAGAKLIGINNRDLNSLELDLNRSEKLRRLINLLDPKIPVLSLSGVKDPSELLNLKNKFSGVLIGTALMKSQDPGAFVI